VPGVELFVALQEEHGDSCARRNATVLTDKNGRFRCRGLTPGVWSVFAKHDKRIEGTDRVVTKDRSESVELRLQR
jgi:hypothetical protein